MLCRIPRTTDTHALAFQFLDDVAGLADFTGQFIATIGSINLVAIVPKLLPRDIGISQRLVNVHSLFLFRARSRWAVCVHWGRRTVWPFSFLRRFGCQGR